ncbi:aminotransferase class I/II-fold pyridoxal phosphate-dependent enzyme [Ructibacterium gallinarum]|uniref:Aminotransferase n=1 Tax=Ructibacterium gallinarum TaxID=2779355 RepID=A0A9D5LYQ5_9FIRM|nr:aminotransferase class I/II-fold pyridoxal phosphate-dependent enzyme [Ructibacterium gallinarum]MBE5040456.1 aminotransferase class I/II-fold pyridoxal phosphate-dependent enzyme [Ructibacterium gallinarum]
MDMRALLNPVVREIPPSGIRRFFDIAAEMEDAISLGVGEPDFVTPWHIRNEGIYSLEKGKTYYTSNAGLKELRVAICAYLERRFGLKYDPLSQTLVTVGGSEAIDLFVRSVIKPGDEVLIPEPSFVCYRPIAALAGGVPVPIVTKAENHFRLTPDELRAAITPRTKVLVLPFPNNPTGAVMRKEHLEALADVLKETDILVLADEIYAELTYGNEKHISIAAIDGMYERTVLVSGFSKAYAMTGWRLGYACGHPELIKAMTKVHQFAIMSAPTTAQYAAIEALQNGDDDIAMMRDEYDRRRRVMVKGFNDMGLACFNPEGAFYTFPCIKSTGMDSNAFCEALLYDKKVAVVPGTAFGDSGEGFIRCSYAYSVESINLALERIEAFVKHR